MVLERAESVLDTVATWISVNGIGTTNDDWEDLTQPLYVTDNVGQIIYSNRACREFAGFDPAKEGSRWIAAWKLLTLDGEYLSPEHSATAIAAREQRNVRGFQALAERPDGTRVRFAPFPTLLFGPEGALMGTVNLLIDMTTQMQVEELQDKARRYRRLATNIDDESVTSALTTLATECEERASLLLVQED